MISALNSGFRLLLCVLVAQLVACATSSNGVTPSPTLTPSPTPVPLRLCVRDAPNPASSMSQQGRMVLVQAFPSKQLGNQRTLRIYLPPSYDSSPSRSYPVLYMHDGQNLFSASTAAFGVEWEVDENLDALVSSKLVEEVIVVGIDNTSARMDEYTPSKDADGRGGQGDVYARFVINEVKTFVDSHFRTQCEAEFTSVAGSSLGGLISLYMGTTFPEVFAQAGVVSPSLWWDDQALLKALQAEKKVPPVRFWVDVGTGEGSDEDGNGLTSMPEDTRALVKSFLAQGLTYGESLAYLEVYGAGHNEAAWADRIADLLTFFYATPSDSAPAELKLQPYGTEVGVEGFTVLPSSTEVVYQNGLRLTLPGSQVLFGSTPAGLVSIDGDGWITGLKAGEVTLSASHGGLMSSAPLRVQPVVSNEVNIRLHVQVPSSTPSKDTVYLTGSLEELGSWNPGVVPLTRQADGSWQIGLVLPRGQQFEFKFTRGSWSSVEKDASCKELNNRVEQAADTSVELTVASWADQCGQEKR